MSIEHFEARTTHALPPGRAQMRYLNLRMPLGADAGEAATTTVRCFACGESLLSTHNGVDLRGLAVKCPACRVVSEV